MVELRPEGWQEQLATLFRAAAGHRARWTLRCGGMERAYVGQAPHPRRWLAADDPCLLLPPGATDGVHVLAEMALHLRLRDGVFFLVRRKWYETEELDCIRLGPGPVETALEVTER